MWITRKTKIILVSRSVGISIICLSCFCSKVNITRSFVVCAAHVKHQITVKKYPQVIVTGKFKSCMNSSCTVLRFTWRIHHFYRTVRLQLERYLNFCTEATVDITAGIIVTAVEWEESISITFVIGFYWCTCFREVCFCRWCCIMKQQICILRIELIIFCIFCVIISSRYSTGRTVVATICCISQNFIERKCYLVCIRLSTFPIFHNRLLIRSGTVFIAVSPRLTEIWKHLSALCQVAVCIQSTIHQALNCWMSCTIVGIIRIFLFSLCHVWQPVEVVVVWSSVSCICSWVVRITSQKTSEIQRIRISTFI